MKKANKIIKNLGHIKGNKVFNAFEITRNQTKGRNLEITNIDIVNILKPYEVNFKALYKVDFDDVVYDDAQGNYIALDLDYGNDRCSGNSYNWNGQCVFNYRQIQVVDNYNEEHNYVAVMFHRYGDVRGNYTDYMVLDMDIDQFFEILVEESRRFVSVNTKYGTIGLSCDILKEGGVYDLYSPDLDLDEYDCYIGDINDRSITSIRKEVVKYLKEKDLI